MAALVLGLSATLALPVYQESVRKARRAEGRTAVLAVLQQQEQHYSRHGRYQPFSAATPHGFKWFSGASAAASAYELSAAACEEVAYPCIRITARPGGERVGVAYQDARCGTLSVRSDGRKTASGGGHDCW